MLIGHGTICARRSVSCFQIVRSWYRGMTKTYLGETSPTLRNRSHELKRFCSRLADLGSLVRMMLFGILLLLCFLEICCLAVHWS